MAGRQTHFDKALSRLDERCRCGLSLTARYPLRAVLVLLAVVLPAFLSGFFALPPIDRTEVRYAQVSKQMLETGEFTSPHFQEHPQPTKPIGVFWLQAAAVAAIGGEAQNAIWAYRLPSLLGALLAVIITYLGACRHFGREAAFAGALLLGVNLIVVLQAHLALSKGLHLAFVAAAQWSLAHLYIGTRDERDARFALIFWAAQGLSILTGAFALPLLSLATIAGLIAADRDAAWLWRLRPLWGLPLAGLIVTPWIVVLSLNPEPDLMRQAWSDGLLGKLAGPQMMNWRGFPGMYVAGLWLCLLPGAVYLIAAARRIWNERGQRSNRFLLAWVVPYLVALELFSAKPPLYSLQMVMPAVTLAIGVTLVQTEPLAVFRSRWSKAYWAGGLFHALLPTLALAGIVVWAAPPFTLIPALLVLAAAAGIVVAQIGLLNGRPHAWLGLSVLTSILIYFAALQLVLPNYQGIWTSSRLGELTRAIAPCVPGRPLIADYGEPSAVFDMGTWTYVTKGPLAGQSAANWLDEKKGRIAFVTERADRQFHDQIERVGLEEPLRIACMRGLNVGRFFWTKISLYVIAKKSEMASCPLPDYARCGTQE